MKWFKHIKTIEELRKEYKKLLKKYHPDNANGSIEITQEINAEYDLVFANLSKDNNADNNSYSQEEDEQFRAILNAVINFNITIEIIGTWVWCFDCYAVKDQLKELGFKWANKKKAWVWHADEYTRRYKKDIPLDDIRAKYGSQEVKRKANRYALD